MGIPPLNSSDFGRRPVTITLTVDEWAAIIGPATSTIDKLLSAGGQVAAQNVKTAIARHDEQMTAALS